MMEHGVYYIRTGYTHWVFVFLDRGGFTWKYMSFNFWADVGRLGDDETNELKWFNTL